MGDSGWLNQSRVGVRRGMGAGLCERLHQGTRGRERGGEREREIEKESKSQSKKAFW